MDKVNPRRHAADRAAWPRKFGPGRLAGGVFMVGLVLSSAGCVSAQPRHRALYAPPAGHSSVFGRADRAVSTAEDAANTADRFIDTVID